MDHRIDNETLNKAIYTVITTKYKKDAQEAHRLVESEGYVIYKDNGKFVVRNDKTYKAISGGIHPMWQYYIISIKDAGYPTRVTRDFKHYAHTDKMNLVSYLDTPHNMAWQGVRERVDRQPNTRGKFWRFISERRNKDYHAREVERIREQIATLTERLEQEIRADVKAQADYKAYRKEIGLDR